MYDESQKDYEVARHALFFNDTGSRDLYQDYVSPCLAAGELYVAINPAPLCIVALHVIMQNPR